MPDLEETDDAYVIEVELPGVSKDDIDIECRGRRITVSGEREEKKREGVLRKRTRSVGRFFHEVVLPGDIDEESIDASLDDGVLTVRVPKDESEKERTRTTDIRWHHTRPTGVPPARAPHLLVFRLQPDGDGADVRDIGHPHHQPLYFGGRCQSARSTRWTSLSRSRVVSSYPLSRLWLSR